MSTFIEYHVIQNIAPANLNRDDTGQPKDALFGGHRRARISSQSFKRAVRTFISQHELVKPEFRATRTMKLKNLLSEELLKRGKNDAERAISQCLAALGLKLDDSGKTEYLLFLGRGEIDNLVQFIDENWDALNAAKNENKSKKEAKANLPSEIVNKAKGILDGKKAVDIALFGRMLADLPTSNLDAACQVAHTISTHKVEREFDYFTAMDDLGNEGETGAGMIGHTEFNSATHYRYAVLDVAKLLSNLQRDKELTVASTRAFSEAFALSLPSGKQNSFAAHNPPAFFACVVRHRLPMNLANAFESPIIASRDEALTYKSVKSLQSYQEQLSSAYGDPRDKWCVLDLTSAWNCENHHRVSSIEELCKWVADQTTNIVERI